MFENRKLRGALAGLALGLSIASPAYANKPVTNGVAFGDKMYTIDGAEYTVYTDNKCTTVADDLSKKGTADAKLIINYTEGEPKGISNVVELKPGKYWYKETSHPSGYMVDKEIHEVTITAGSTQTNPVKATVTDKPVTFDLSLLKKDGDPKHPQGAVGDATLKGAKYEIRYYDSLDVTLANYKSKTALKTWTVETDENGNWDSTGTWGGDKPYTLDNGSKVGLLGTYVVTEIVPPEGYLLDATPQLFKAEQSADSFTAKFTNSLSDDALAFDQANPPIMGGVAIQKLDDETKAGPQGEGLLNAKFRLYNISDKNENSYQHAVNNAFGYPIVPALDKSLTAEQLRTEHAGDYALEIKADELADGKWIASSEPRALTYGTYRAVEIDGGTGYHLNKDWYQDFQIRVDGAIVTKDVSSKALECYDPISRLGIKFEKVDTDALGPEATAEKYEALRKGQGNAALAGAEFAVTVDPNTKYPVIVDGQTYQPGDVVAKLVTKWDAATNRVVASTTSDKSLPYANYTVTETKAPKGYLPIPGTIATITLDDFVLDANSTPKLYVDGAWIPITNVTMVKTPINN